MANEQDQSNKIVDPASDLPLPPPADISGAATSTEGSYANLIAAFQKSMGGDGIKGPTMVPGPKMTTPMLPQPPMHISPAGVIPQGPFGSVGERKRADRQALLSSMSNVIQTAQDRVYQKKVDQFKHDFETLSNAIQGYKEGQATGDQNMIQHNANIINELVGPGSKKAKEFAKAFDVNLNPMAQGGGKGKQQKPEASVDGLKAWMQDQKNFSQGTDKLSPQANAIMRSMPQTLQMSPELAAQAEMVKAKLLPTADAKVQAFSKVADALIQGQSRLDLGQLNKQAAMLMRGAIMASARLGVAGKLTAEHQRHIDRMLEIERAHQLAMSEINPERQANMLEKLNKNIDDTIGNVGKPDASGKLVGGTGIQGQIQRYNDEIEDIKGKMSVIGKSPFMMDQMDDIIQSKHPFLYYGATEKEVEGLKQIKARQIAINQLQNEMKALTLEKMAIGRVSTQVAGKGVYGPSDTTGKTDSTDSTGVSDGDGQDGEDDTRLDENIRNSVDSLERDFGYAPDEQPPQQ